MKNPEKYDHNATEMRPDCKPLTLEKLREMDGKPVWVEDKQMPELSGWGIMRDDVCDGYHGVCFIEEYGKRWIAYAHHPAHIDLEEWECPLCGEYKVFQFLAWETSDRCLGNPDCMGTSLFCPHCGRPLTPEARAMLEKRLRG